MTSAIYKNLRSLPDEKSTQITTNFSRAYAIPHVHNKPITFTNLIHRHHKKTHPLRINEARKSQQKGIIFIWPQRKRFYYRKELNLLMWALAQTFYWMYTANLFPCGSVLPMAQPPWKYVPPIAMPENRNYIIEPDWDSHYQ